MKNLKIFDQENLKKIMSLSLISFVLMTFSGCGSSTSENSDVEPSATPSTMPTIKPDFPETTIVPFDIGKHFAILEIESEYSYAEGKYMCKSPIIPDGYEYVDYDNAGSHSNIIREMILVNSVPILLEGTYNHYTKSYDFKQFGVADPNYVDEFNWEDEEFESESSSKKLFYNEGI